MGSVHLGWGIGSKNVDVFVELLQVADIQPTHYPLDEGVILNNTQSILILKLQYHEIFWLSNLCACHRDSDSPE